MKSLLIATLLVLFAILTSPPEARAEAQTLEQLLVEKGLISSDELASVGTPQAKLYWNKGTKIDFPQEKFSFGILTLLQPRYSFSDQARSGGKENASSFELRRARLYLSGTALDKEFSYLLMSDFVGAKESDGSVTPDLQDAVLSWAPSAQWEIKAGQFLLPLMRESFTAPNKLQFPEFALTTSYFAYFRQQGMSTLYANPEKSFKVGAGIFNGQSDGEGRNKEGRDTEHLGSLHLRWEPLARIDALEEGDISQTPDLGLSIGAAYAYSEEDHLIEEALDSVHAQTATLDAVLKYRGGSLLAEYTRRERDSEALGSVTPEGVLLQAGQFIIPQKFEIALRYDRLLCDDGHASGTCAGQDRVEEGALALNYFITGHQMKVQLAYHRRRDTQAEGDQHEHSSKVILQATSAF